jgi:hypothetical protein
MTALARTRIATAMAVRDQLRRPLVLALIAVIPAYVITRSIAETLATPRRTGLPDGVYVTTTMKALHGAGMGGVVVAFVAALLGVFVRKRRSSTRSRCRDRDDEGCAGHEDQQPRGHGLAGTEASDHEATIALQRGPHSVAIGLRRAVGQRG